MQNYSFRLNCDHLPQRYSLVLQCLKAPIKLPCVTLAGKVFSLKSALRML